jgi:hypothetical protein
MGVCLERVFAGIKEAPHEGITAVFNVHHLDVFTVEEGHAELKFFWGLWMDVVNGNDFIFGHFSRVDFDPHSDLTLRQIHARMEDFTSFSGLVFQGVPFREEVTVFKV